MLKLNLQKEPYWLDLPAQIKLKVRPLSTAVMSAAQHQSIQELLAMQEERKTRLEAGADVDDIPNLDNPAVRRGLTETVLIKALARHAILEWEGVMRPDSDAPAEITDQSISDLMDVWFVADAFWKQYTRSLDLLESEGNGSRPAANGTSAAGLPTADIA